MIGLSLLSQLRKAPRLVLLILVFITIFLLSFLLVGCTGTSDTYSSVYLAEFQFNTTSDMYPLIEKAYEEQGVAEYSKMKVRANYLGICVHLTETLTCSAKSDLSAFNNITGVSFFDSSSNTTSTTLDLVKIASQYSEKVVKPWVLLTSLILEVFLFIAIISSKLTFLPFAHLSKRVSVAISLTAAIVWAFGSMWNYIGGNGVNYIVDPSSMFIITSTAGPRAQSMTWVCLAFTFIVAFGLLALFIKDYRAVAKESKAQAEFESQARFALEKPFYQRTTV